MNQCKAQVSKIESFSTVDGPGIRTTIFFNQCKLRCKFCHNPETWKKGTNNYTVEQLKQKILNNKPYFKKNGGVTFSGGEPLLHEEFLIKLCKELRKEKIHIALDTAGIGNGNYEKILKLVDLVILDIKHIYKKMFKEITQVDKYDEFINFINQLNKSQTKVWIRQVIIPDVNDNEIYIKELTNFLNKNISNISKVELLPFHTLGFSKYKEYNIKNPYENKQAMDSKKNTKLYKLLNKELKKRT